MCYKAVWNLFLLIAPTAGYSYLDHPLHQGLPDLSNTKPTPVILDRYYFKGTNGRYTSEGGIFAPGVGNYQYSGSSDMFCDGCDVLVPSTSLKGNLRNRDEFMHVTLNRPAKIYVVLALSNPHIGSDIELEDVPSSWTPIVGVSLEDGRDQPLGEGDRWNADNTNYDYDQPVLPAHGVVVDTGVVGTTIMIPHWKYMEVRGKDAKGMVVLFVPADDVATTPIRGHAPPVLPAEFTSFLDDSVQELPMDNPPVPNTACPSWLHDLYIEAEHGGGDKWWQTWHPPIDPIYWCYFNHDHGGYPFDGYRPKFHFTAFHTPDPTTLDGRQSESHNGFKVFPFQADDGRFVILTLHMHMSQARRFYARHHTLIVAVLSAGTKELEMELHMKMDFGFAEGRFSNSTSGPFTAEGFAIQEELDTVYNQRAFRNINIINVDEYYPASLDPQFRYSGDVAKGPNDILDGRYEAWHGRMNCARNLRLSSSSGLKWEMHGPQTGMRFHNSTALDNIQRMSGDGMGRAIVLVASESVEIGPEHCEFSGGSVANRDSDGVFYTDAYFSKIWPDGNAHTMALRQYMKPSFAPVIVGDHRAVTNDDTWNEVMSYDGNMVRRLFNMELAMKIFEN